MYIPFRRSEHFESLCEIFGEEAAAALCRQLAPNGDRRRIPNTPNPRLLEDLGSQSHHAEELCYRFASCFVYFPRLVDSQLLEKARSGESWYALCDQYRLNGDQLNLLLAYYLGRQMRRSLFPSITAEMREYISHQNPCLTA
jgi:hypothetical protein